MRRLKEAETQKRKKNKRISVDTSKAFVFEGHSPFRHICRFGIEMTMEIEVNRKHPEWTFRYKCKVFLLLPNVSRAMSNVKTSQKVNLNAGIGAKVKITHRHTQRRRTYTQRLKKMKETRLFHGLDKALPGKILNRSQKSSAEKCSCFFSEEKNGALKKRQNALLLQRWWCRISLRVYSANSVPRQRHGVLGNGLETSNRCPVRCIQALLCWPESKAWPRARLFFIF